jgi:hypothetical protein
LTAAEATLLRKVQRRAHYLDKGFKICGFRVGWTFFIGIIPGAGDIADALLNYFLVLRPSAKGAKLPPWLVSKMWLNNSVSAGVGLIPIAGDVLLAIYKANSRNAKLLEEYLRVVGEQHIAEGLSGLTPEPPALPGQQSHHTDDDLGPPAKNHPAQNAAKGLVQQHGSSNNANGAQPDSVQASTTAPSTTSNRKFWQRKN